MMQYTLQEGLALALISHLPLCYWPSKEINTIFTLLYLYYPTMKITPCLLLPILCGIAPLLPMQGAAAAAPAYQELVDKIYESFKEGVGTEVLNEESLLNSEDSENAYGQLETYCRNSKNQQEDDLLHVQQVRSYLAGKYGSDQAFIETLISLLDIDPPSPSTPLLLNASTPHATQEVPPMTPEVREELAKACRKADMEQVQVFLDQGYSANTLDKMGETMLSLAVRSKRNLQQRTPLVKLLLDHGAAKSINIPCGRDLESTPLMEASIRNNLAIVELLLDHGADSNQQDADGNTALYHAGSRGHDALAQYLISCDADPSICNLDKERADSYCRRN